jgi:hypothetical protein
MQHPLSADNRVVYAATCWGLALTRSSPPSCAWPLVPAHRCSSCPHAAACPPAPGSSAPWQHSHAWSRPGNHQVMLRRTIRKNAHLHNSQLAIPFRNMHGLKACLVNCFMQHQPTFHHQTLTYYITGMHCHIQTLFSWQKVVASQVQSMEDSMAHRAPTSC